MTQHNTEKVCINEARIVKLEQKVKHTQRQQNEHEQLLKELNKNIQALSEIIAATQATFNTLKWIIGILVALFSGVLVFLITEIIKLI